MSEKEEKDECLKKCLQDTKCRYLTIKDHVCYYRDENNSNKIKKNNLVNEIRLIKSLPEEKLKKWFSSIDLYCHLSDDEGLSTAILHALSNKTLLLVSKNKGNKFLKNHALLTYNNLDNVIENIIYAKNNISFFDKRINIAYNFAKKHYSSEKMFDKYCSVFLDLYEKCN